MIAVVEDWVIRTASDDGGLETRLILVLFLIVASLFP